MECESRHCFHVRCASDWLKVRPTCPLCRKDFRSKILDLDIQNVEIIEEDEVSMDDEDEEEIVHEEM